MTKGWNCTGEPSVCALIPIPTNDTNETNVTDSLCGNGMFDVNETCDDNNTINSFLSDFKLIVIDDGCSSSCLIEVGYLCIGAPSIC